MELYATIKLVHIVSSTLLFGTGVGTTFHLWYADRSRNVQAIAVAARTTVLVDWIFILPVVALQPLTGFWMLDISGQDLYQSWIVTALGIFVIAGFFWFPVIGLQIMMRNLAVLAAKRGATLPAAYHRYRRWWLALSLLVFAAALAIFTLMVLRPTLW